MERMTLRTLVLALALPLALTGCYKKEAEKLKSENQKLVAEKQQLEEKVTVVGTESDEMKATLDEVQQGLEELRGKELAVIKSSIEVAQEGKAPTAKREQLKSEIATIRKAVKENLDKLAALEKEKKAADARAKAAGKKVTELNVKVTTLERLTSELRAALEEKDLVLVQLEEKVLELSQTVEAQAGVIKEKETVIDTQTKEINKAYVVIANKKDLREKGLIEKKGDVLGLGGGWLRTGKFDPETFREIDVTQEAEFPMAAAAKKIKVLSDHPKDSYEVVDADATDPKAPKTSVLKIKDVGAFWKGSKYLVVMLPN